MSDVEQVPGPYPRQGTAYQVIFAAQERRDDFCVTRNGVSHDTVEVPFQVSSSGFDERSIEPTCILLLRQRRQCNSRKPSE